ncbi:hypothetical protein PM082_021165 [Marasmius tenuissimus]|nr:hypothetical protein PM082_021165 [Marasmius tenuissimus]
MARAPSDITKWSPGTSAVWFKVAQAGKTADGKWAATDGLYATNSIYTFTIPKNLKAGQYIIRHERPTLSQDLPSGPVETNDYIITKNQSHYIVVHIVCQNYQIPFPESQCRSIDQYP